MDEKQPVKRIDREKRAEEKLNIREGKYFLNGEDGQKKSQNLKITFKRKLVDYCRFVCCFRGNKNFAPLTE